MTRNPAAAMYAVSDVRAALTNATDRTGHHSIRLFSHSGILAVDNNLNARSANYDGISNAIAYTQLDAGIAIIEMTTNTTSATIAALLLWAVS